MSRPTRDEALLHFGVKGMKWGVRNSGGRGKIRRGATKAGVALNAASGEIKKGEEKLLFTPKDVRKKAASATKVRVLSEAVDLNRDSRFKGKDLKKDETLSKTYHSELGKKAEKIYKEELGKAQDEKAVELIESIFSPKDDTIRMRYNGRGTARHADEDDQTLLILKLIKNGLGQVTGIEIVADDTVLAHGEIFAEEVLKHFGEYPLEGKNS